MKRRLTLCALVALTGHAHAQILSINSASITTYRPTGASAVQDIRPLHYARGVGIDGVMRAASVQGWALAGNPFGDSSPSTARIGEANLSTGTFAPTEVDIALPQPGMARWVIGRSFNGRQETSGAAHRDSNGYQGYNWFQMSQPAVVVHGSQDQVYIVYGADRFLEFKFVAGEQIDDPPPAPTVYEYRGVNGCAGVMRYTNPNYSGGPTSDPDYWVYYDQHGVATYFFGATNTSPAQYQIWKMVDPAGNTAYVGHATTAATAISSGYTADGAISTAYDAAGRRYCYTYSGSTIAGVKRLKQVLVETKAGENWEDCGEDTMVTKVNYEYYESDETTSGYERGKTGDLKLVTVTTPMTDSGVVDKRRTHYRYYTGAWSNSDRYRGEPHQIKLVLGPEGCRNHDYTADSALEYGTPGSDPEFLTDSDANLTSYSLAYIEYLDTGGSFPYRVFKALFNGECGCGGGGANGTYELAYGTNGSFSGVSAYDDEWKERAVIKQPDTVYATQYFDECGQPISRVVTNTDPSGSPTKTWATELVRDSTSGCVTALHTPKNITAYTHSTGAFTRSNSVGLVHVFGRVSGGTMDGFPELVKYKEGNTGTAHWLSKTAYTSRGLVVGPVTDYRPMVDYRRSYHTAWDGVTGTESDYYHQTAMTYAWWSSTNTNVLYVTLKQATTTNPTVSTGTNGSNSATTSDRFLRMDGTTAYTLAPDGVYTHMVFTNGQLTKRIDDVKTNTGGLSPDPNGDFGVTETGDGWHRVTEYAYDAQGRSDTMTEPDTRVHKSYYSVLVDGRNAAINWPRKTTASGGTYFGPAGYAVTNHAGKSEFTGLIAIGSSGSTASLTSWIDETDTDPILALTTGSLERMSTAIYDSAGSRVTESRAYHTIPASGAGSSGTNYDKTTFVYDAMGRRIRTMDPTETITRMSFDELGRSVSTFRGTDDTGMTGSPMAGSSNMVEITRNAYDGGSAGGNSHMTTRTAYVENSTTDQRVTSHDYDFRGRLLLTTNPAAPHSVYKYDNLGRVIASAQYSAAVSSSTDPAASGTQTYRTALSKSFYDELGRVYKTERWKIDQADGSDDDSLTSNTWRDAAGRVIKIQGNEFAKIVYDRLGRTTHRFTLGKTNDSGYSDADDVSGDDIIAENQAVYESSDSDNVVMTVALINRFTVSSSPGALDSGADANVFKVTAANLQGRAQIAAMWYDDLDRVIDTVQYGTYGGSDFDRKPSGSWLTQPTRSDTALRTTTSYNDDGTVLQVEAPGLPGDPTGAGAGATAGSKTRYTYDQLGRQTKVINNYADGTPGGGTHSDQDQTIKYEFSAGLMTKMIADLPSPQADQETLYIYGTAAGTPSANKVTTKNLLRAVKYADSANVGTTQAYIDGTSDADVVSYGYNAQGQKTSEKDQSGTTIVTVYDDLGREIHRKATALGSNIDNAVLRITTAYLARGLPDTVTQFSTTTIPDPPDPDTANVVDQLQYTYDGWGNLTQFNQDVDSVIGVSGRAAFNVGYTYAKATGSGYGRQTLRRSTMTGTSMNTVTYGYSAFAVDDAVSRVTTLTTSSVTVASYDYYGTQALYTNLDQVAVNNTFVYDWDRFNRTTVSAWYATTPDTNIYEVAISYDRNGGIYALTDNLKKDDADDRNFDALFTNDDLGRLIRAQEGKLVTGSITKDARDERWMDGSGNSSLTQTGNWSRYRLNLNSGSDSDYTDTGELDDTRTHSITNELDTRDVNSSGGSPDYTLTYDLAGNMTSDGNSYGRYTYDAFGRMRKAAKNSNGTGLVAEYRYNGLGMKIAWHYDTTRSGGGAPDNTVDGNDPWYYFCFSEKWQAISTFRDSDSNAKERFIYHTAGLDGSGSASYIDDTLLIDADVNSGWTSAADSTKEIRRYYLHNWRHDVVSILTDGAKLVQNLEYLAYGKAYGLPAGDRNGSGTWTSADATAISGYGGPYRVDYDTDYDGDNDAADVTHANSITGGYYDLGLDKLSSEAVFNRKGYAGYEHAWELDGTKYHVRHRVLDSELGRWTRRDPMGYVEGVSVYEYVCGQVLIRSDPSGLAWQIAPIPGCEHCFVTYDLCMSAALNRFIGCNAMMLGIVASCTTLCILASLACHFFSYICYNLCMVGCIALAVGYEIYCVSNYVADTQQCMGNLITCCPALAAPPGGGGPAPAGPAGPRR